MKLWLKILLVALVQMAALMAMVADKQWTLMSGTPVLLQTEPVDPRSLFMGDYARLNYAISQLPLDGAAAVGGDRDFKRHDTVWVALKPDPAGAVAVSVHRHRGAVPPGLVALKGEVQSQNGFGRAVGPGPMNGAGSRRMLQVRYGIEQYFVQEGTGRQIERPTGGEKVAILVAIDSRGKAGISAVLFDGREAYRETLF